MYNIDDIMDMLSWNNSEEIQSKGIELAKNVRSLNVFIQPINQFHGKDVWDNCAKILVEKSDEILEYYLYQLFEWLKDMNWPGAFIIYERLKKFLKVEKLAAIIDSLVKKKDKESIDFGVLSGFLENEKLKKAFCEETIKLLEKA